MSRSSCGRGLSSTRRYCDGYNITNLNEALSSLITSMLRTYRKEHRRVVEKMKESRKGKLRGAFGRARTKVAAVSLLAFNKANARLF